MPIEILYTIIFVLLATLIWLYTRVTKAVRSKETLVKVANKVKQDLVELEQKIAAQEAETLKFKLQPHTLNNIMANLKVFSKNLYQGMDALSDTLDYILYKGNNNFVSIQEEMHFISRYLDLNDLFIAEIDSIKLNYSKVDQNCKQFTSPCIPHLITAYLIENAFKHGNQQHPDFLSIELTLTDLLFSISVINKLKRKPTSTNGGFGITNMKQRLELLIPGRYELFSTYNEQDFTAILTIHF